MTSLISSLLKSLRGAVGQKHIVPDIKITSCRFGSDYGGWDVVQEKLSCNSIIYSFGVGNDVSFDIELIDKYGVTVFAFDPTPKSIKWVEQQFLGEHFRFFPWGASDTDGKIPLYAPENPEHVSYSIVPRCKATTETVMVEVKRVSTIMKALGHDHIDVLKMDIEGAEYGVIDDIYRSDIRPKQILLEFHHFLPGIEYSMTVAAVRKLRKCGYRVFSVSSSGHELGLIHRSFFRR